ncbi:MAG TPA: hypothetical protein VKG26_14125 [Bacteroidia bacterium]|nr:hypothetical protein [Bacteroidia bacterium]
MQITPEKAKELIVEYCNCPTKGTRKFFSFFAEPAKINLSFTRILQPWEKDANLALPSKLIVSDGFIDKEGCNYVR